jgi:MFS family permease
MDGSRSRGEAGLVDLGKSRDFRLFVLASVFMGLGACVNSSSFNNYLRDRFAMGIAQRTFLEFPRELPGFLVSFSVGILAMLGEVRIAAIAASLAAAGMLALGWIPSSFILMVGAAFVYSSGQHIFMPISNSIGMSFASSGREGSVLGRIQSSTTIALVTGTGILLLLFKFAHISFRAAYSAGALSLVAAAVCLSMMSSVKREGSARRFVVRREYSRFYAISVLYGARKQLFITFAPWMIVDLFKQSVSTMTLLFFIVSVAGIFLKPAVGRLTDRFGPRAVLGTEAILTVGLCLIYAFSPELLPPGIALIVVSACYVSDQALDSVSMARSIYARKLMISLSDLAPTLSFGISIDHIVSMTLPMLGGLVWHSAGNRGYRWIFLGGAIVALANFALTLGMQDSQRSVRA